MPVFPTKYILIVLPEHTKQAQWLKKCWDKNVI